MVNFHRIVKQQLTFLKTVENKLFKNSKSYCGSGENFNIAVTFALPATMANSNLEDSALWALSEPYNSRERELLKTRIMTPEAQREWASSAPETKEVQLV